MQPSRRLPGKMNFQLSVDSILPRLEVHPSREFILSCPLFRTRVSETWQTFPTARGDAPRRATCLSSRFSRPDRSAVSLMLLDLFIFRAQPSFKVTNLRAQSSDPNLSRRRLFLYRKPRSRSLFPRFHLPRAFFPCQEEPVRFPAESERKGRRVLSPGRSSERQTESNENARALSIF